MNEQPSRPSALPQNLPRKVLGAVTSSTVLYLGLTVLMVVGGALLLAWNDKAMPEAVIALGGVALGFLGRVITDSPNGGAGG